MKIVKAICITSSLEHKYGYVSVSSPHYWNKSGYFPVVNNAPLRKKDVVAVLVDDGTAAMTGVILGKIRDGASGSEAKNASGSDILFETGNFVAELTDDTMIYNKGTQGMVYIKQLLQALRAIEADIIVAMGGQSLSTLLNNPQWVYDLEDHKILH
jgi:hypothetical protein